MAVDIHTFLTLRSKLPIVDVRSQAEFGSGHVPGAINIPLLNNEERVAVGTDYKQKGQAEAIKTGFKLVGPRLLDIVTDAERIGKELLIYCWRGGMRSSNFGQFVGMAGIKAHQLKGGYKVYRQQVLSSFTWPINLIVISGFTGSGKSEVLQALKRKGEQVIDLEKLTHHKGSVFGGLMMPTQPTTEQFQNNLFEDLLKFDPTKRIWIEDEAIAIGKIFLPEALWRRMKVSPAVEIIVEQDVRIARLTHEYGKADPTLFLACTERIIKKLGGQHFNVAKEKILSHDMPSAIGILLTYYDKAYLNGLKRKGDRVKLRLAWNGVMPSDFADHLKEEVARYETSWFKN